MTAFDPGNLASFVAKGLLDWLLARFGEFLLLLLLMLQLSAVALVVIAVLLLLLLLLLLRLLSPR